MICISPSKKGRQIHGRKGRGGARWVGACPWELPGWLGSWAYSKGLGGYIVYAMHAGDVDGTVDGDRAHNHNNICPHTDQITIEKKQSQRTSDLN